MPRELAMLEKPPNSKKVLFAAVAIATFVIGSIIIYDAAKQSQFERNLCKYFDECFDMPTESNFAWQTPNRAVPMADDWRIRVE